MHSLNNAQMRIARQSRDARFDGKFFVAVLSTGIFCRPVCPARMAKEENVRYHNSAISAIEAGYRPCKLCKPDSAPFSFDWLGNDAKISQAVRLFHSSPDIPIEGVATQLNVTERYLRKLFNQKLGVSPSSVRQSIQLLFAKQLLQQTRLTITDVALAAGFQTTRAMQIAMKKRFSVTPGELRKQPESSAAPAAVLFLSYRPPYKWQPLRDFLSSRCIPGIEAVSDDTYARVINCNGSEGKVIARHRPDKNGFEVTLNIEDARYIKPVFDNLARMLDCNADWLSIESALSSAGVDVSDTNRGIRLPGVWSPFEAGCRALLGQQVSVAAAITKTRKLVDLIRQKGNVIGFPEAQDLTPDIAEQIAMPKARQQTLIDYANAMCDEGVLNSLSLGDTSPLLAIKGIGPWTCQYLALRGLGDPDVWLEKDLAIIKQCKKYSITADLAKPWRSYLTLALWHDYMGN